MTTTFLLVVVAVAASLMSVLLAFRSTPEGREARIVRVYAVVALVIGSGMLLFLAFDCYRVTQGHVSYFSETRR